MRLDLLTVTVLVATAAALAYRYRDWLLEVAAEALDHVITVVSDLRGQPRPAPTDGDVARHLSQPRHVRLVPRDEP